ncbi:MAG TPA: TetR/AcrR family transcriptional regulator [Solirubrobacteraceae bacterium]|nr:TetR/AcrR family transcriptional regulator [Solirubrobacteraceae bacterium]
MSPTSGRRRGSPLRATVPKLTRQEIVAAAIEIADRHGLDAVSMRRVASAIGSGTMSLYRHVSSRDELLDAMLDAVYSELRLADGAAKGWRRRIEHVARAQRRMLRAHPWVASLVGSRPPLLPGFLRLFQASLGALLDSGLNVTEAAGVSSTINAFVIGHALLEHAEHEARRRTGLTRRQWRARHAPLVRQILDSGDYPAIAQYVRHANDIDPDAAFDAGLTAILDGAERHMVPPHPAGRR